MGLETEAASGPRASASPCGPVTSPLSPHEGTVEGLGCSEQRWVVLDRAKLLEVCGTESVWIGEFSIPHNPAGV